MTQLAEATLPFLQQLADIRVDGVTKLFNLLTYLGDEKLFVLIALIVYWCFSKRGGLYMLTVGFAASSIGQTLKAVLRVPRPWNLGDHSFTAADPTASGSAAGGTAKSGLMTKLLGGGADGWSFPSGHTLISVGTYGGMAAWFKSSWVRAAGIILAILIPFTRLYLGVHTPVDIIGGVIIALVLVLILKPFFAGKSSKAVRAALIGNIVLAVVLLIYMYAAAPSGLAGEDIANYASGIKNIWQLVGAGAAVWVAFEADERWLHFKTKAPWWAQIIKVIGGSIIVLALQLGIQKIFGYSSANLTFDNMTRMGMISAAANFVSVACAMAIWPLSFKRFAGSSKGAA